MASRDSLAPGMAEMPRCTLHLQAASRECCARRRESVRRDTSLCRNRAFRCRSRCSEILRRGSLPPSRRGRSTGHSRLVSWAHNRLRPMQNRRVVRIERRDAQPVENFLAGNLRADVGVVHEIGFRHRRTEFRQLRGVAEVARQVAIDLHRAYAWHARDAEGDLDVACGWAWGDAEYLGGVAETWAWGD